MVERHGVESPQPGEAAVDHPPREGRRCSLGAQLQPLGPHHHVDRGAGRELFQGRPADLDLAGERTGQPHPASELPCVTATTSPASRLERPTKPATKRVAGSR